jgi:hypothetical protein
MTEQSVVLGHELGSRVPDPADPAFVANSQHSAELANENCDRAVALAHKLSVELREAQERINQLELEADGLCDQFLAEAKVVIHEVQSNADARVNQTIQEADERIARLRAEAQNQIGSLRRELAQATRGSDQVKAEADSRFERIEIETNARVAGVEAEAKKRIDLMRCETEEKVTRLEADLTEARKRADRAEEWLTLIRREVEDHLMPSVRAMRDGENQTDPSTRLTPSTLPALSRFSATAWFRRLWWGHSAIDQAVTSSNQ